MFHQSRYPEYRYQILRLLICVLNSFFSLPFASFISIEYWFRCMDLDGDGVISLYELEYFYEDQVAKMEALGIEAMPFEDCVCSVLDLVKPTIDGKISLGDLKRCGLAHIFFNTFLNLDKYVEYEQRDPFASFKVRLLRVIPFRVSLEHCILFC